MTAAAYDIVLEQGASFRLAITWNNPDNPDGTPGGPIDLTDATAHMQVRASYTADPPLLDLTDSNGGIVLGGTAGTVTVEISGDQTATLKAPGSGVYDLFVHLPGNDSERLIAGKVKINPGVTR